MGSGEVLRQYMIGAMTYKSALKVLQEVLQTAQSRGELREAARARQAMGLLHRIVQYHCGEATEQDLCLNLRDVVLFLGRIRITQELQEIIRKFGAPYGLSCTPEGEAVCKRQLPEWLTTPRYAETVYGFGNLTENVAERPSNGDLLLRCHTRFWNYKNFEQKLAVHTALQLPGGYSLLISLPTGGGKSLVTQMLAAIDEGLTVVIVPTVALALDQQMAAQSNLNHSSEIYCYEGEQSEEARKEILSALGKKKARLLFTSPEAIFKNPVLYRLLEEAAECGYLKNIVVDEAHVVPDWGVFFRPDFQIFSVTLRQWREKSGHQLRTYLLSATLSDDVVTTLFSLFGAEGYNVQLRCDALRQEPRFYFHSTATRAEQIEKTIEAIEQLPKPMVVYVLEPREAVTLQKILKERGYQNIPVFTGDTKSEQRRKILEGWKAQQYDVVVATSAFGIGVDKPDVRTILHACVPENLSRFYQEVGRGGRDRLPSLSVFLPCRGLDDGKGDLHRAEGLVNKRVLTVEKVLSRWDGLLHCPRAVIDGDQCFFDTTATPPTMTEEEAEYAGNRNMAWNINLLLFLYRTGYIDLISASYQSEVQTYFMQARILRPEILSDPVRMEQALEEPRQQEQDRQMHGYRVMRRLVQHPKSECWGRSFQKLFPLAPEVCNGCPVDLEGRPSTDSVFQLRMDPDLHLEPQAPSKRLKRRMGSYAGLLIKRPSMEQLSEREVQAVCGQLSDLGLAALVVPEHVLSSIEFRGLVLSYEEFFFAAQHTPYLFAGGVCCMFSDESTTNQTLFQALEQLQQRGYRCLLYCNESMILKNAGKPIRDCVDYYRVDLKTL